MVTIFKKTKNFKILEIVIFRLTITSHYHSYKDSFNGGYLVSVKINNGIFISYKKFRIEDEKSFHTDLRDRLRNKGHRIIRSN